MGIGMCLSEAKSWSWQARGDQRKQCKHQPAMSGGTSDVPQTFVFPPANYYDTTTTLPDPSPAFRLSPNDRKLV
jgi:hypothetical protein